MPVTESLSTAVLVKETKEAPGANSGTVRSRTGSVVSVGQPLGTQQDKAFADSPEADSGDGAENGRWSRSEPPSASRSGFIGDVFPK